MSAVSLRSRPLHRSLPSRLPWRNKTWHKLFTLPSPPAAERSPSLIFSVPLEDGHASTGDPLLGTPRP
jgi:hypothetical protein